MVFRPRDEDSVYDSLRGRLTGKIDKLTNFVSGSFNDVWTRAFSEEVRDNEIQASAAQLSGWVEYAGGPITESDLDDLDIDNVTVAEINEYTEEEDLDELARLVGIRRDPGTAATGEVTFTTTEQPVEIPSGTLVGTQPDARGDFLEFSTDETVETAQDETEVTVSITAETVGERFNVGAQSITFLPNPPAGVQGVINTDEVTGGVDRESNPALRERTKEAVFATSGGGTSSGVIGYIQQNTEARDVLIDEFVDEQPPYVDVVVDGDDDEVVADAIAFAKPVGIRHNLIRPTNFTINVEADVIGQDIDTSVVENDVTEFLNELGIGDDFFRDKLIQTILNGDEDIITIDSLTVRVSGCVYTYDSTQQVYDLRCDNVVEVEEVRGTLNGDPHVFIEGTDYALVDTTEDDSFDSIDWSIGGDNPDDGTDFFVDYISSGNVSFEGREKAIAGQIIVQVV